MSRNHSSQMCRAACASDDDAQPPRCSIPREFSGRLRCSVRGEDARLVRHAKLVERLDGTTHGFPIRFAAHDYSNQRFQLRHARIVGRLIRSRQ